MAFATVPHVAPYPQSAINDWRRGHGTARVQPVMWQPIETAYLPGATPNGEHPGAIMGDQCFDKTVGILKVFDGTSWVVASDFGLATYNRLDLTTNFKNRAKTAASMAPGADDAANLFVDPDFEVRGTNYTMGATTSALTSGYFQIGTGAVANDQAILLPHRGETDAQSSLWKYISTKPTNAPAWEASFALSSIADIIAWAGLRTTPAGGADAVFAVGADNVAAFFRFDPAISANWYACYSIGGADTVVDSGVAAAATTLVRLAIVVGADGIASFYINGAEVAESTAFVVGTDMGKAQIGIQAKAGTAKNVKLFGMSMSSNFDGITVP